jgi:hypothetical protein
MGSATHRAAALLLVAACTGRFEGGTHDPGSGGMVMAGPGGGPAGAAGGAGGPGGPGGSGPARPVCQATADPGATPLFRLSTLQYRNTVRDLLAASGVGMVADELKEPLGAIPDDSTVAFRGMDNRITADHLAGFFRVATTAADAITGRPERLSAFAGACALTAPLPARCLDDFLTSFGRRALRRPLTADELASYRASPDRPRAGRSGGGVPLQGISRPPRGTNDYGFTNFNVMRSLSPMDRYFSLSLSLRRSVGGSVQTPSG